MPTKSKPGVLNSTIAASRQNLNRIRKIEKSVKEYNPVLAWTLTPLTELVKFGPEIWADIDDAFLKEKKRETTIAPPGWDDIIKTGFDAPVSPQELSAYKLYKKSGGKNPLTLKQEETLKKRKDRAIRIAQSPTPSSIRSIGTIMTWVDDIQDSMVALSFVTRLAAKITGKFSSQLAKKWVMPLSYVSAAADLIDITRVFKAAEVGAELAASRRILEIERALAAPSLIKQLKTIEDIVENAAKRGYKYTAADLDILRELIASEKRFATAPVIKSLQTLESSIARNLAIGGAGIARGYRKRNVYYALASLPNLTTRQFKYLNRLRGFLPSFAEAVQIAQTTAQTTGYGLSLGGIVGYASDEVFGKLRGSARKPLTGLSGLKKRLQEAQTHYPIEKVPTLVQRSLRVEESVKEYQRLYKSPELTPLTMSALNILNIGPQLMSVASDLSVDDNLFVLIAVKRATAYLSNIGALDGWEVWSKPHLDLPVLPPPVSFDNQFIINEIAPNLVREEYLMPYIDGVSSITPRVRASLLAPKVSNGFSRWLKPLGSDMRVNYAMGNIADLAGDSFGMYEGENEEMVTRLTPAGRSVMTLHDYGLADMLGTPREIEIALHSQISDWLIRRHGSQPTFQEVSALIDLLRRLI